MTKYFNWFARCRKDHRTGLQIENNLIHVESGEIGIFRTKESQDFGWRSSCYQPIGIVLVTEILFTKKDLVWFILKFQNPVDLNFLRYAAINSQAWRKGLFLQVDAGNREYGQSPTTLSPALCRNSRRTTCLWWATEMLNRNLCGIVRTGTSADCPYAATKIQKTHLRYPIPPSSPLSSWLWYPFS